MGQFVIFLDDGGVINDSRERRLQWYLFVAEYFVPKLGGTAAAWAEANYTVITRMLKVASQRMQFGSASEPASRDRRQKIDWLRAM